MRVYVLHPHIISEVLRPYRSEDMAHFVSALVDLLTLKLVRNVASVMGYPPTDFGDTTTICFRFMGPYANTAQTDQMTLRPIFKVMAPVADVGCRPVSVYQV